MPKGSRWLAALIGLVFVFGVASAVVRAADDDTEEVDSASEDGDETTTTKADDEDDKDDDETTTTRASTTTTRASTTTTAGGGTTTAAASGTTTTRARGSTTTSTTAATTTTAAPSGAADLQVGISRNGNGSTSSTYTVVLRNLGPGDVSPASITVTAPAGVRLCRTTQTTSDGNCAANAPSSITVSGVNVPEAGAFVGIRAEGSENCVGDVRVAGSGAASDPVPGNNDSAAPGPAC